MDKNNELMRYTCLLKGNYRKGIENLKYMLSTDALAKEFIQSQGIKVLFGLDVHLDTNYALDYVNDRNSADLLDVLRNRGFYDDAARSYLALKVGRTLDDFAEILSNAECMAVIISNLDCLKAIIDSEVLYSEIIGSEVAMNAVVSNNRVLTVFRHTQKLWDTVLNNPVAVGQVAASAFWGDLSGDADITSVIRVLSGNAPASAMTIVDFLNNRDMMGAVCRTPTALAALVGNKEVMLKMSGNYSFSVYNVLSENDAALRTFINSPYWSEYTVSDSKIEVGILRALFPAHSISAINSSVYASPVLMTHISNSRKVVKEFVLASTYLREQLANNSTSMKTLLADEEFSTLFFANRDAFESMISKSNCVGAIRDTPGCLRTVASDLNVRKILMESNYWSVLGDNVLSSKRLLLMLLGREPDEVETLEGVLGNEGLTAEIFADDSAVEIVINSSAAMSTLSNSPASLTIIATIPNALDSLMGSKYWSARFGENNKALTRYTLALLGHDTEEFGAVNNIVADTLLMGAVAESEAVSKIWANSKIAQNAIWNNADAYALIVSSGIAFSNIAKSAVAMELIVKNITAIKAVANSATAMEAIAASDIAIDAILANTGYISYWGNNEISVRAIFNNENFLSRILGNAGTASAFVRTALVLHAVMQSPLAKGLVVSNNCLLNARTYIDNSLKNDTTYFELFREEKTDLNVSDADITGEDLVIVASPRQSSSNSSSYAAMFHGFDKSKMIVRINTTSTGYYYIGIGGAIFAGTGNYNVVTSRVYKAKKL